MKLFSTIIFLFLFPTFLFSAAMDEYIWVANGNDHNVMKIRKSTGNIEKIIAVNGMPVGVAVDEQYVWVSCYGIGPGDPGVLLKISKETGLILKTFKNIGEEPVGIAVDPNYVWVCDEGTSSNPEKIVYPLNKLSDTIENKITVGLAPINISINTTHVYTANNLGHNVSVIDRVSKQVVSSFASVNNMFGIFVCNDYLWTTGVSASTIQRHEKITGASVLKIDLGLQTPTLLVADNFYLWIVDSTGDNVIKMDKDTLSVVATTGYGLVPLGLSQDFDSVWVTDPTAFDEDKATEPGTIAQISKKTSEIIKTIHVGVFPVSIGDMTGFAYDTNFGTNPFTTYKKVKGSAKKGNVATNALDQNHNTYYQPKKKAILKITLSEKKTIQNIGFDIKLLSTDTIKLKWKLQMRKNGKWKTIEKGKEIITSNQTVHIGTALNKQAKKFRLKMKNKKYKGVRGSFGITEILAYE